jgi:hypothetical protein
MNAPTLPILYTALEPLDSERHAGLHLRDVGHGFAAHLSSIPLAVEEFALAGRHMPVVFAAQALQFTRSVEAAFRKTQEFSEGLSLMGLLQPSATQFEWEGKPFRVDGFFAVDRERLSKLTGEQLATLRDKGWLDAIYAHLLSLGGIPELKQMQG